MPWNDNGSRGKALGSSLRPFARPSGSSRTLNQSPMPVLRDSTNTNGERSEKCSPGKLDLLKSGIGQRTLGERVLNKRIKSDE